MRLVSLLALAAALLVALTAPALAQEEVVAPPGNSGVDEYLEVVPGAAGDRPATPRGTDEKTPLTPPQALGPAEARALEQLGPDGVAAAAVAASGAASDRRTTRLRAKTEGLGDAVSRPAIADVDGRPRADVIVKALAGGGGGMGLAFPLVLVASMAAGIAVVGLRRFAQRR